MANTYMMSTGDRVSKTTIDYKVREAKKKLLSNQLLDFGYNFCVNCNKSSSVYLDCAHDISVKECQESGKSELAWCVGNMKVKCRECHQKQDGLSLDFQINAKN